MPEDTTILLDNPRTLRSHWGASVEYLDIYRAVYRWNADHPDRAVHVLAADIRGWPIASLTEHMATGGFVNRDVWMAAAFRKALEQHPEWRTLIFMGGYHGLKVVGGEVKIGKAHDRFDHWFAGYLADDGFEVYTILSDALQDAGHAATRVFDAWPPRGPASTSRRSWIPRWTRFASHSTTSSRRDTAWSSGRLRLSHAYGSGRNDTLLPDTSYHRPAPLTWALSADLPPALPPVASTQGRSQGLVPRASWARRSVILADPASSLPG